MKKIIFTILLNLFIFAKPVLAASHPTWWKFQSVDTMKYSRDLAREKMGDPDFDRVINDQVAKIAATGATHLAVDTPYDEEFIPFLNRWVRAARQNNLSVWFRGNFSGWEGWFSYPKIGRSDHLLKLEQFIVNNSSLFKDGDILTPCPECENGGPGDPRKTGDLASYRQFLITEYQQTQKLFKKSGKNIVTNFASSNGDVARLVFDRETVKAMGGVISIDHYVATPEKLIADIQALSKSTGANIVLGEIGVPIPDIHGKMSDVAQAQWLKTFFELALKTPSIIGMNYWVNTGSSTELWNATGQPRQAVTILTNYFSPKYFSGKVTNELTQPLSEVLVEYSGRGFYSDKEGNFSIPLDQKNLQFILTKDGYLKQGATINPSLDTLLIKLVKQNPSFAFRIRLLIFELFRSIFRPG